MTRARDNALRNLTPVPCSCGNGMLVPYAAADDNKIVWMCDECDKDAVQVIPD